MPGPAVRAARPDEAGDLTGLCLRSKACWGYDDEFMRQCRTALTVSVDAIESGRVWVVEADRRVLGVASVAQAGPESGCDFELAHLFVEPDAMGRGVGRLLFAHCVAWVRVQRGRTLEILSDPGAVPFYVRMGARLIGDAPSDAIPGRRLPLLQFDTDGHGY